MLESLTLRIHYPLEDGDLLLRTDRDWNADVHPTREAPDRTWFDFPLTLEQHYNYYKPIVRRGGEVLWSKGENYLAVPNASGVRDVYPHFFDDATSSVDTLVHLPSKTSARTHALRVFTPPGYAENTLASYPVLYMQDGQNLFFPQEAFAGQTWKIPETLRLLDAMNLIRRAITVGIYPQERIADYTRPGYEEYGRYLAEEVKPWVDANYRSLTDAPNTVVIGSSLGGVVSFYLAWQWPEVFGHAGCLSSTFGYKDDLMERVATEERRPIKLYLDSGWPGDNFEATYAMRNHLLDRGYQEGSDLLYLAFPWAQHNEQNWAMRAHIPFQHFFRG
jgi:predicted alpha/beta superfamily hydrolase